MHPVLARRFRSRARIITAASLVGAVVVIAGGALGIALAGPDGGILVAYGTTSAAIVAMIVVFGILSARHARTLAALAARHPDGIVLLARRLPPVVSDLPAFLAAKGLDVEIGDGWYATLVDRRGIAIHSAGPDPRELVLMEWREVGEIRLVRTATVGGDTRWSVTVDVKPYVVPLTADLGGAWGIVTMAFDATDIQEVLRAIEAKRP